MPLLEGSKIRELALSGCTLPGLAADTAQIDGRLVLSRSHLTGPLVLTRAQIHNNLDLRDTVITVPGTEAISAVRLTVGGDVLCTNLAVQGTFRISGATISGEFDLESDSLSNPGGNALDAYHVHVTEDFTFHPGFSAEGRIILSGATVAAAIGLCGARLNNASDIALEAFDVNVARNFDLGLGLSVNAYCWIRSCSPEAATKQQVTQRVVRALVSVRGLELRGQRGLRSRREPARRLPGTPHAWRARRAPGRYWQPRGSDPCSNAWSDSGL
ncbi:hypothetical protein ACFY7V_31600 [[Kitasatospora] papulosa]|uniref:Uncharacterized protein n=2 Tax=Streptomyces TaxID=1883 RepID=A0A8D4BIE5_STRFA|nr:MULTISPECIES: hypothetical protein [unclassified Streptomyces]